MNWLSHEHGSQTWNDDWLRLNDQLNTVLYKRGSQEAFLWLTG
jgi:hypothetical protein